MRNAYVMSAAHSNSRLARHKRAYATRCSRALAGVHQNDALAAQYFGNLGQIEFDRQLPAAVLALALGAHGVAPIQIGSDGGGAQFQVQRAPHLIGPHGVRQRIAQLRKAGARGGGHPDLRGESPGPTHGAGFRRNQVDLVEHHQLGDLARADASQHFADLQNAFIAQRIAGIHHMQQHVGVARLLQRRAKRRHQFVRQCTHESDGVGQHHLAHLLEFRRRLTVGSRVAKS